MSKTSKAHEATMPQGLPTLSTLTPAKGAKGKEYLPMAHGKATDSLAKASSKDAEVNMITGDAKVLSGDVEIVLKRFAELQSTLGVNTHKLLCMGVIKLTEANNFSKKDDKESLTTAVVIPAKEYAYWLGYDVYEHETNTIEEAEAEKKRATNTFKEAKKKIKRELDTLRNTEIKLTDKHGNFLTLSIIGSRGVNGDYIYMTFDNTMATYLMKQPLTQYPTALFAIDARNPNAYSIGYKMAEHYNMDNNRIRGTYNRLKISTLLQNTNLQSIEEVREKGRSWVERIKEPFENALESLYGSLISDYKYVGAKGMELVEATEYAPKTYEEWVELYVEYELINPPEQEERMERRAEEKKENQEKQRKNSAKKKAGGTGGKQEKN